MKSRKKALKRGKTAKSIRSDLMKIPHNSPPTVSDWSDVAVLQRRLAEAAESLGEMCKRVGEAKHVIEYDSDRRKRALACAMKRSLDRDESAAKSEAEGRASAEYFKQMKQLGKEHEAAVTVLTEWEVEKLKWETARSLLAMMREQVKI